MTFGSGKEIGSGYSEEGHNIGKGKGKFPFSYSSSTSSSSSSSHHQYKSRSVALVPPNNWNSQIYGTHNPHRVDESPPQITLDLMDSSPSANRSSIEKEHMFDKVMTPSDVGKLNRLVIPKQFAEKYFPLDSAANEKGLLLNFEDRNGKSWRFRYSYWNSSQSYVMTKGWSRFVKEMKLDAGDIVSFQRGVGELGKDCLYIDWRRRPDASDNISSLQSNFLPYPHNFSFQHRSSNSWNPLLMRPLQLPNTTAALVPREYMHFPRQFHYGSSRIAGHNNIYSYGNVVNSIPASFGPVVQSVGLIESVVPVIQGKAAAKRLRLFGVNMDCPLTESDGEYSCDVRSSSSQAPAPVPAALRFYNGTPLQGLPTNHHNNQNFLNKGKSSSMSFDFDM